MGAGGQHGDTRCLDGIGSPPADLAGGHFETRLEDGAARAVSMAHLEAHLAAGGRASAGECSAGSDTDGRLVARVWGMSESNNEADAGAGLRRAAMRFSRPRACKACSSQRDAGGTMRG